MTFFCASHTKQRGMANTLSQQMRWLMVVWQSTYGQLVYCRVSGTCGGGSVVFRWGEGGCMNGMECVCAMVFGRARNFRLNLLAMRRNVCVCVCG